MNMKMMCDFEERPMKKTMTWNRGLFLFALWVVLSSLIYASGVFHTEPACAAAPGPINAIYGQQLCCCISITGGMCCNASPYPCGSLVPGCVCQV